MTFLAISVLTRPTLHFRLLVTGLICGKTFRWAMFHHVQNASETSRRRSNPLVPCIPYPSLMIAGTLLRLTSSGPSHLTMAWIILSPLQIDSVLTSGSLHVGARSQHLSLLPSFSTNGIVKMVYHWTLFL